MKIFLILFLSILVASQTVVKSAEIQQYFNCFYSDYLALREVSRNDREILNFLKQISDDKTAVLEENFLSAKNKCEIETSLLLINEEYYDLIDNINFELNYIKNRSLNKKENNKFKKAHKKFMRQIKKNKLKCLR